ncbi:MAG: hypothetical protein ACRDJ3_00200 [Solirubrobacteraceae bacterium]
MAGADEAGQIPQAPAQTPQAPEQKPGEPVPASTQSEQPTHPTPQAPGFGERGRMRRRARFLRKARELAYRDLGGLVFDLHRFGQRNDQVVLAKLATLGHIDTELRALEEALRELRPVTVLREVGIAACPRCAAIHGSDDRFCPGCGLAFDMSADRPLSTAPVTASAPSTGPAQTVTPSSPPGQTAPAAAAASNQPTDLSIGRPTAPVTPTPPATPVAARPVFPTKLSPPAPGAAPESPARDAKAPEAETPSLDTHKEEGSPVGPAAPRSSPSSQPAPSDNGEQKREPEEEPTQILRPPARGA